MKKTKIISNPPAALGKRHNPLAFSWPLITLACLIFAALGILWVFIDSSSRTTLASAEVPAVKQPAAVKSQGAAIKTVGDPLVTIPAKKGR